MIRRKQIVIDPGIVGCGSGIFSAAATAASGATCPVLPRCRHAPPRMPPACAAPMPPCRPICRTFRCWPSRTRRVPIAMPRAAPRDVARQQQDRDERYYREGKSYLDRKEYDRAIEAFNRVIDNKGSRADGALYWRAYAQNKLGQRDDAVATLTELQNNYASSHWLDDAKALQVEIRQQSGQPVSPESATDEDLKLLALNSLMNSDPERSVPMLENLLKSSNSPRLKERALFVLAQSRSPKAREIAGLGGQGRLQSRSASQSGRVFGHLRRPRQLAAPGRRIQEFQRCADQARDSQQLHGGR